MIDAKMNSRRGFRPLAQSHLRSVTRLVRVPRPDPVRIGRMPEGAGGPLVAALGVGGRHTHPAEAPD